MTRWLAQAGVALTILGSALPVASPVPGPLQARSQTPGSAGDTPAAPQAFSIRVDAPARVGMPIWLHADLEEPLVARYPLDTNPLYLGSNRLEVKRDGIAVPQRQPSFISRVGLVGVIESSVAPEGSPRNRLPLHVLFRMDEPGRYSVRWTVARDGWSPERAELLAASNWLDFDVAAAKPDDTEAWLRQRLPAPPTDAGLFVGDYLPELLAAPADPRVVKALLDATYSGTSLIAASARDDLKELVPAGVLVPSLLDDLQRRGPNGPLAYLVSSRPGWFQDHRTEVVRSTVPFLRSTDDTVVTGALQMLGFARQFDWLGDPTPLDVANRAVLAAAPNLMTRGEHVTQALAIALSATGNAAARDLLWQLAEQPAARRQALICLTGIQDPRDLPRIVGPMHDFTSMTDLVPQLMRAYGDTAIPYLMNIQNGDNAALVAFLVDRYKQPTPPGEAAIREAVVELQTATADGRRTAANALLDLAMKSPDNMSRVGSTLLDAVLRRPASANADAWRDAALILGRLHHPLSIALTLSLEREGATDALIELGEPAVPSVVAVLQIAGPARRRLAATVLGAIGSPDAATALRVALGHETDAGVKGAIQSALAHLGLRPPRAEFR